MLDQGTEGQQLLEQAKMHYKLASTAMPCTLILNNYAWFLAICPVTSLRDADKAVSLAQQAISMTPDEGTFWNTLGVAYYRKGDAKQAIKALDRSVKLRNGGDAFDWFFLAMAHWQMGTPKDKETARTYYWKAVKNLEDTNIYTEPVWPHCLEAAAFLGIDPPEHEEKDCSQKSVPKKDLRAGVGK